MRVVVRGKVAHRRGSGLALEYRVGELITVVGGPSRRVPPERLLLTEGPAACDVIPHLPHPDVATPDQQPHHGADSPERHHNQQPHALAGLLKIETGGHRDIDDTRHHETHRY